MSRTDELSESLPRQDGYTHLLGVPTDVIEQLGSLAESAFDGKISLGGWEERHAQTLSGARPAADATELRRLEAQVDTLAKSVTEDYERFVFLSRLATNLRLLQTPNPDRELRDLEETLPTMTGGETRAQVERRLATLRAMTGRSEAEVYEPATRMLKALQVGTLEETYRWLQTAVSKNPAASVQDLLTRSAIEVADAKLELDRYDELKARPDERRRR